MFRATVEHDGNNVTLRLEGSLSGPCLVELEKCWRKLAEGNGNKRVLVDLNEVTFVSSQGRELLEKLCRSGAQLQGEGLMTGPLVDEIRRAAGRQQKNL